MVIGMVKAFDLNENVKMICYDNGNITFVRYHDRAYERFMLESREAKMMREMLKA